MSTQNIERNLERGHGETRGQTEGTASARERLLASMPVRERRLHLAGVSTAVLEGGDGPPIVLLHGPGGYAAQFLRVIPHLVKGHRVVAPDLPGHGASTVADGPPLTVESVVGWLGALIEQTCSGKPALVGQLLGGAIAARFASAHGDRIRSLVLVDSFGLRPFQPAPEFGLALSQFRMVQDDTTHESLWRYCAHDLDRLRAQMGELWPPFQAYNIERARSPGEQAASAALMELLGAPALPPADLARIAVPTTLIWGRHDLATPLAVAEAASARYGWPLHVIDEANDAPPIEQPEAFVAALRSALDANFAEA